MVEFEESVKNLACFPFSLDFFYKEGWCNNILAYIDNTFAFLSTNDLTSFGHYSSWLSSC